MSLDLKRKHCVFSLKFLIFAFFKKIISKETLLSRITRIFTLKCQHVEQNQVLNAEHLAKSVTRQVHVNASIIS